MAKRNSIRAEDITSDDILSIYERILPLLNNNPENLDIANELNKQVIRFIWYDFFHYVMSKVDDGGQPEQFRMYQETWTEKKTKSTVSNVGVVPLHENDPDKIFDESIEHSYQMTVKRKQENAPEKKQYHYHRLISREEPKVAIGFFRFKNTKDDNSFSKNDVRIFKKLSPHILSLLRTILNPVFQTKPFRYFEAYSHICADITNEFKLSESEAKLLPEILFGYSNDEIAQRNFISFLTVKKHLQHIFKKTGVKNRLDFISHFFTSPQRVEL